MKKYYISTLIMAGLLAASFGVTSSAYALNCKLTTHGRTETRKVTKGVHGSGTHKTIKHDYTEKRTCISTMRSSKPYFYWSGWSVTGHDAPKAPGVFKDAGSFGKVSASTKTITYKNSYNTVAGDYRLASIAARISGPGASEQKMVGSKDSVKFSGLKAGSSYKISVVATYSDGRTTKQKKVTKSVQTKKSVISVPKVSLPSLTQPKKSTNKAATAKKSTTPAQKLKNLKLMFF